MDIINRVLDIVGAVTDDGANVDSLGTSSELKWLADMSWNLGTILIHSVRCKFSPRMESTLVKRPDELRLQTGAAFMESAEFLYKLSDTEEKSLTDSRCHCLLMATGARLDSDTQLKCSIEDDIVHRMNHASIDSAICSINIQQSKKNCLSVFEILENHVGIQELHLKRAAIIFEFIVACKIGGHELNMYMSTKKQELLRLSPSELMLCSSIAERERGGSAEVTRTTLSLALQICMRESEPDFITMGSIFSKLIELSPSRAHALEKVEEFAQLLCQNHVHQKFAFEDIDHITSLSFNFGITLSDLGQSDLAERFLSQSLSLLQFASTGLQKCQHQMQVPNFF